MIDLKWSQIISASYFACSKAPESNLPPADALHSMKTLIKQDSSMIKALQSASCIHCMILCEVNENKKFQIGSESAAFKHIFLA